ncbi:hypothetical protein Pfo_015042 [Paulownia fortunei]|nr:hypothetical protein Pfo_015042 [Paulownia fortunei]
MASNRDSSAEEAEPPSSPKTIYKDPDGGRQRFLLELELVHCLANPTYIHCIAVASSFLSFFQKSNSRNAMAYPANKDLIASLPPVTMTAAASAPSPVPSPATQARIEKEGWVTPTFF